MPPPDVMSLLRKSHLPTSRDAKELYKIWLSGMASLLLSGIPERWMLGYLQLDLACVKRRSFKGEGSNIRRTTTSRDEFRGMDIFNYENAFGVGVQNAGTQGLPQPCC